MRVELDRWMASLSKARLNEMQCERPSNFYKLLSHSHSPLLIIGRVYSFANYWLLKPNISTMWCEMAYTVYEVHVTNLYHQVLRKIYCELYLKVKNIFYTLNEGKHLMNLKTLLKIYRFAVNNLSLFVALKWVSLNKLGSCNGDNIL